MLSEILKKYLDENNLSVRIFAIQCKMTEQSIRGMLRNKHKLHRNSVERLIKGSRNKITKEMLSPYIFIKDW